MKRAGGGRRKKIMSESERGRKLKGTINKIAAWLAINAGAKKIAIGGSKNLQRREQKNESLLGHQSTITLTLTVGLVGVMMSVRLTRLVVGPLHAGGMPTQTSLKPRTVRANGPTAGARQMIEDVSAMSLVSSVISGLILSETLTMKKIQRKRSIARHELGSLVYVAGVRRWILHYLHAPRTTNQRVQVCLDMEGVVVGVRSVKMEVRLVHFLLREEGLALGRTREGCYLINLMVGLVGRPEQRDTVG